MPPLHWSDEYRVGIEMIDKQHRQFFDIVHRLYEECLECKGEDVTQKTLDFLRNYAVQHFKAEEALMRQHRYPDTEAHLKRHDDFLDQYDQLMIEMNELGPSQGLADRVADMVQNWLVDHIAETDMNYVRHIREAEASKR